MRMNYSKNGLTFESSDIQEALLKNEAFECESIQDRNLSWHHLLVHNATTPATDLRAYHVLNNWGMDPSNGSDRVEKALASKRKSYQWDVTAIEEAKKTPQYQRALQLVQDQFGKPFNDGTSLFSYQVETAALMIAKKRLLLALDMGLGSVLCSDKN